MALVHIQAALSKGGLDGLQKAQRDWSPYLVHFTNWSSMADLRDLSKSGGEPSAFADALDKADAASFDVAKLILGSRSVHARSPSDKAGIPACVCLSECNIGGLISHSERYGRFGFVFRKDELFGEGARPCAYLDRATYAHVKKGADGAEAGTPAHLLFGLSNVFNPPGNGGQVQDYSHEREWRIFNPISFDKVAPAMLLAPSRHVPEVSRLAAEASVGVPVVPIDVLFEWGA